MPVASPRGVLGRSAYVLPWTDGGFDIIDDERDDSMRGTLGAAWIGDGVLVWNCVDRRDSEDQKAGKEGNFIWREVDG